MSDGSIVARADSHVGAREITALACKPLASERRGPPAPFGGVSDLAEASSQREGETARSLRLLASIAGIDLLKLNQLSDELESEDFLERHGSRGQDS